MNDTRRHLVVAADEPYRRGRSRGTQLRDELAAALDVYLRLFAVGGLHETQVRDVALGLADTVGRWRPWLHTEIDGVAAGAGLEGWQVMALNGRTEILAHTAGPGAGECSTLVCRTPRATFGVQTWDWHEELDPFWHTQQVTGTPHGYVGLTECGVLGKIGVNDSGVGVHFNILGHGDDAGSGVPVHLLATAVLAEAADVEHAVQLLCGAPVATSGALTLLSDAEVACVELSPGRVTVLPDSGVFTAHTNHFLDPINGQGEKRWLYQPDSGSRLALIEHRARTWSEPQTADGLVDYLYSDPGEPALCCLPAPGAVFGERWTTLATVILEPGPRRARVLAGSPADARRGGTWHELVADAPVGAR